MELWRSLGALVETPAKEHQVLARLLDLGEVPSLAEHSELFLFQLYPFSSVYLGAEGMLGGEARDRVAGFLRALGLQPAPEPDHLTALLTAYAGLCERAVAAAGSPGEEIWVRARLGFLHEHLLSWLPPYLLKLGELAAPFYRRWGELLWEALAAEAERLGPPERASLALRVALPLADPREDGSEIFISALLAPLRSGFFLVRDDLRRCAAERGLGMRAGERRYVLSSFFGQDAAAILGWLSEEARRWGRRLDEAREEGFESVELWRRKVGSSEGILRALAAEVELSARDPALS